MSIQPNIEAAISSRIKFLDPVRFGSPYRYHILFTTTFLGCRVGRWATRYIRDHNPNHFAQSNWAIIRTAHRTYNLLFPEGSARRYFVEVALPDNFLLGLHFEVHLHTMSYPIERLGSPIGELSDALLRTFFFAYCLDKVRQIAYVILRFIPSRWTLAMGLALAPTSTYTFQLPNEEFIQYRN